MDFCDTKLWQQKNKFVQVLWSLILNDLLYYSKKISLPSLCSHKHRFLLSAVLSTTIYNNKLNYNNGTHLQDVQENKANIYATFYTFSSHKWWHSMFENRVNKEMVYVRNIMYGKLLFVSRYTHVIWSAFLLAYFQESKYDCRT